jgi:hypothetical protein
MFGLGCLCFYAHCLFGRRSRQASLTRRQMRPSLEILEDRFAPAALVPTDSNLPHTSHALVNQGASAGETPHPSTFQAVVSLYIDGAAFEASYLANEFIYGDDFNIDNYFASPSQLATVRANAAAAGINYDAVQSLSNFLNSIRSYSTIQPDIAANAPYAGAFTEFALRAGAQAVYQAAQLS